MKYATLLIKQQVLNLLFQMKSNKNVNTNKTKT